MNLFNFTRKSSVIKPVLSRAPALKAEAEAKKAAEGSSGPVFRSVRSRPLSRM